MSNCVTYTKLLVRAWWCLMIELTEICFCKCWWSANDLGGHNVWKLKVVELSTMRNLLCQKYWSDQAVFVMVLLLPLAKVSLCLKWIWILKTGTARPLSEIQNASDFGVCHRCMMFSTVLLMVLSVASLSTRYGIVPMCLTVSVCDIAIVVWYSTLTRNTFPVEGHSCRWRHPGTWTWPEWLGYWTFIVWSLYRFSFCSDSQVWWTTQVSKNFSLVAMFFTAVWLLMEPAARICPWCSGIHWLWKTVEILKFSMLL